MAYVQKLSPLDSYKLHLCVQKHFNDEKFDLFTSKGIRYTQENFDKRSDKNFYYRLSGEYGKGDLAYYYMANHIAGKTHISEYVRNEYNDFKGKMHSIQYRFEQDCNILQEICVKYETDFKSLFKSYTGGLPAAIQLLNGSHINLETICIIDELTQNTLVESINNQVTDKFVWPDIRLRILKYSPWMSRYLDKQKLSKTLKNYL